MDILNNDLRGKYTIRKIMSSYNPPGSYNNSISVCNNNIPPKYIQCKN